MLKLSRVLSGVPGLSLQKFVRSALTVVSADKPLAVTILQVGPPRLERFCLVVRVFENVGGGHDVVGHWRGASYCPVLDVVDDALDERMRHLENVEGELSNRSIAIWHWKSVKLVVRNLRGLRPCCIKKELPSRHQDVGGSRSVRGAVLPMNSATCARD